MDENKILRIEKLKAAQEKIDQKIKELEGSLFEEEFEAKSIESADDDAKITKKKNDWKKLATVTGVVALATTGVMLAVRQPWKTAKVVGHLVHIV